jgi:hypothetical protein
MRLGIDPMKSPGIPGTKSTATLARMPNASTLHPTESCKTHIYIDMFLALNVDFIPPM